jgi:ComF family protein
MLLPTCCPICGRRGAAPCDTCIASLRPAPALPPPVGIDGCTALLAYEDEGRELLARLKYRNARAAVTWLAWQLAGRVRPGSVDVICWAPTSVARARQRGFDQARLLARAVARRTGVPCSGLLTRQPGPPQTGLAVTDRWSGPRFLVRRGLVVPARVLVVDDVVTTGATLAAAARTLRGAGAREVWGLAAGRTPHKARRSSSDPTRDGERRIA